MEALTYQSSPIVTFATNKFINVPVILQYENIPLISVVREAELGFTSEFKIFHPDGTDMARVRGTRVFPTEAGKAAGLRLRQLKDGAVFEMAGKTVFEIFNDKGDAFRTHAELYTPDGCFVRSAEGVPLNMGHPDHSLKINGLTLQNNTFVGSAIGILLKKDGSLGCGVG
jgi:hypothetical protein